MHSDTLPHGPGGEENSNAVPKRHPGVMLSLSLQGGQKENGQGESRGDIFVHYNFRKPAHPAKFFSGGPERYILGRRAEKVGGKKTERESKMERPMQQGGGGGKADTVSSSGA